MKNLIFAKALIALGIVAISVLSLFTLLRERELRRQPAYARTAVRGEDDLSFSELEEILTRNQFSDVESTLEYLARNKPVYMSRYALVFKSNSMQGASHDFPRAIVFGPTAKFIMTFNGQKSQEGFDRIETVQFNEDKKTFEFRDISFQQNGSQHKPFRISEIGGDRFGTERACLQCHQSSQPIWNAYFMWPGIYGGFDDYPMERQKTRANSSFRFTGFPVWGLSSASWVKFSNEGLRKGRYQYLQTSSEDDHRVLAYSTDNLFRLNFQRIARLLSMADSKREHREGLAFALVCQPFFLWEERSANKVHNREVDPQYRPNQGLKKLTEDFMARRAKDLRDHDQSRLRRIWEDYDVPISSIQKHVNLPGASVDELMDIILTPLDKFGLPNPNGLVTTVIPEFANLAAYADKYLPASRPDWWPLNARSGLHTYASGFDSEIDIKMAVFKELFSSEEVSSIQNATEVALEAKARYCRDLEKKLPPDLR